MSSRSQRRKSSPLGVQLICMLGFRCALPTVRTAELAAGEIELSAWIHHQKDGPRFRPAQQADAAKARGGSLAAHNDGSGFGATFVLKLLVNQESTLPLVPAAYEDQTPANRTAA